MSADRDDLAEEGSWSSAPEEDLSARCLPLCNRPATNQALYRKTDGSFFLGNPTCEEHKYPLGRRHHTSAEIIDYLEI